MGPVSRDEPDFRKNRNRDNNRRVVLRNSVFIGHCHRRHVIGFYQYYFFRSFFDGKKEKGEKDLTIAGNILMIAGIVFMLFGIIGIFRLSTFYARILIAAKIDTVGSFTFIIGVAVKHGFSFFSLKLLLLAVLLLFINPLITHMIARAVYLSEDKDSLTINNEDNT